VQENATQSGLGRLTKSVTFDLKTLEALKGEKGGNEGKVFNLVRGLQKELDDNPNAAPILQPLKDRAERTENSHQPTRRRERKMQGFKSPGSAQKFLSTHAAAYNTFNVQRHLTSAKTHRAFRATAMQTWRDVVAAA